MEQPNMREQHLQADADSARQQSYNMTVEARREKDKADHLRAVNAKLLAALLSSAEKLHYLRGNRDCERYTFRECPKYYCKDARAVIEEANK